MEYLKLARLAAKIADDKLGSDITVIDVRGNSAVTDCFVFVGATSHLHVRSLEDGIRQGLKESGAQLIRTDGMRGHLWRVLDYGNVLVHIMDKKTREFYAVERLWDQGKKVAFEVTPPPEKKKKKAVLPKKKAAAAPKRKKKKAVKA
jgi:ribosome-associated protein